MKILYFDGSGLWVCAKSMEPGSTFRSSAPKYPTADPHYRILARQRSRFTHYYFYLRDPVLGPMVMRVASFFPFQTTYCLNGHSFIENELNRQGIAFRKHDNAFLAVDGPQLRLQAPLPYSQNLRALLRTGAVAPHRPQDFANLRHPAHPPAARQAPHHPGANRAWPPQLSGLLEKRLPQAIRKVLHLPAQRTLCQQPLADFGLKKGLAHLGTVRQRFSQITDSFAAFQAQALNVHVDYPLLQRLALPVTRGTARFPGIKIHDTRTIRLMEVLLHGGAWPAGAFPRFTEPS